MEQNCPCALQFSSVGIFGCWFCFSYFWIVGGQSLIARVGHPAFLRFRTFPGVDARENFRAPGDFLGAIVFRDASREATESLRSLIHRPPPRLARRGVRLPAHT